MSKSLQRGILFSICVAFVLALSLTLVFFAGGGDKNILSAPQGQVSGVADAAANAYEHGGNIGRTVSSNARTVTDESTFLDALANNHDINLKANLELTSSQSFLKKDNNGNISADPATSGTALVYSGTIYGNGYNITITGSQDISNNSAVWDCGPNGYGDAANVYGGLVGKLTGQIYDLNVTMKSGTMEKIKGNDGGDRWLDVGVIAGIVDDVNARIENCSVTIPANTQITALKSPISNVGWGQSSAGTQYVRAAGIAAELNNGTIVNCTVTNNGCISAGLQENKDDNSITNGYYGAAANAVAWVNNGTLNNIIVKGSGKLIGLKTAAISVVNNSNISPPPTTNAYNGYTGTYEFRHGDDGGNWSTASMYVSGARQAIANFYQASNATTRGGANKDQTSHELANSGTTLTVNPSTYTIYFDPTKSSDDTRLAVLFNNENYSAGAEYELYGASRQISNAQISGANGKVLARNLPATPSTWNSGNNFTASVQIAFDPSSYAALTKYDHGYVDPDNRTTNGTPIGTGEDFEAVFSPSGTISGTDYYLTNDIVITGFTGKEFSGTLDGNGHTIFITGANTCAAQHIGGIVGTLTGTIKNVRVVLVNSVTANTSVSNANVGLVAGHINGGSLINVSVDIPTNVTLSHVGTANDSSLGGIAGSAVSGATFTNVTMNFNGTLSNTRNNDYWPYTSAFVGKPYFKDSANSSANCATFNNIIIRGNGTFASQSNSTTEPPYYAAIGIIQHKGVTDSTAAVYNVNGLIYDFNPQFANDQGATSGNHGACYGLFVNNNNNNAAQVQYYDRLVNYGSNGVYNASGKVIEAYAFNGNGNAPVPNPANIKNITETVTNVTGSTVKAYFMPGDSASENLTLVASASNWNGVTQLQLDGAAPAVTSADDGSNKVVNVAKSTAVGISGNLTLSPYNPYTVITASLVTDTKVYDGDPFAAQVSFAVGGSPVSLTDGQYTITYTDGNATGETNANVGDGTYSLTVTLKGTASDGTQYVFDAQGTKTKTFTYTITPLEVTGTWSVRGLEITYGDAAPDYDQYISIELTNEGTIPGGLTESNIAGSGFTSNYTSGTRAGETVTITAGTFTVGSGFTASNYNFSGITGSGSLVVQKKTLNINPVSEEPDYMYDPHISAVYGATGDKAAVQGLLTQKIIEDYVTGIYNDEVVSFTIDTVYIAATDEESGEFTLVGAEEVADENIASLKANSYLITVTANSSNYIVAEGQFFVYGVTPVTLTVTGVTFEGDFDGVYDGQAHGVEVQFSELLVGDDSYKFGISISGVEGTSVTDAGDYTVTVAADEYNPNYDVTYENGAGDSKNEYAVTISPITLTIRDKSGVYTELTAADIVIDDMVSGILGGDTEGVTVIPAWDTPLADENGYLAAGTYNATLSLSGDKSANYTFGSDTIATVTVDKFDLSGAHITITSEQFTYDGTEKTVEYTVLTAEGGKEITSMLTPAGDKQTNAGDAYTLTLTGGDNFINQATETWSIGRAKLSVTAPTAITFMDKAASELSDYLTTVKWITGFFGSDGYALGAWINDPEDSAVPIGDVAYAAAGTYTATVQLTGENADTNYELSESTLSVTINALDISGAVVTWKEDLTYNAEKQSVSLASVTVSGVVMPVDWFTLQNNTGTDAVTYTAAVAANNSNVTGSADAEFTISPASVTVKWEAAGEISVGTAMPENATDMSALGLTARVTEFKAPGITDAAQYSIVVTANGFDAGYIFTTGDQVTLTPSMAFAEGVKAGNYQITYAPETIVKTATAISVEVSPANKTVSVTYGDSVTSADGFISRVYFTIMSGAEGSALTPDNFTVTVTDESGAAVFGMHGLDAGTYTVTIEGKGAYSVSNENNSFTYTVAPLTLTQGTWSGLDGLKYSGDPAEPVFKPMGVLDGDSVKPAVIVTGDKVTEEGQAINAGTYTATATSDNTNYVFDGKVNVKTFTIAQMVLQGGLTVDSDLTYDGKSKADKVTLTWTIAPLKEGDVTANITFTKDEEQADPIAAGDYTAIVTLTDNTGNYDTTEITSTVDFTIKQLEVVLNWKADGDDDLVYNGKEHTATATVNNKKGNDDVKVSVGLVSGNDNINVGKFFYEATGLTGDDAGNYSLPAVTQQAFVVTPAKVTLTWNFVADAKITYGDSVDVVKALVDIDALNGTIPGADPLSFEVIVDNYSATTQAGTEVTFTVNAILPEGAKAENYTINITAQDGNKLTVGKATLTLTIAESASLTKVYDGKAVTLASLLTADNVSVEGMKNGEDAFTLGILVINGTTQEITNVGEMSGSVTVKDDSNYTATALTVTYVITPKSIGVEWSESVSFTYNGSAQVPTATATDLVGDDSLTLTVTGEQTNANAEGEHYTATVKAFIDGNYKLEQDATVDFTIAPKSIGVEWGNTEFTYNGLAQVPTATATVGEGLVSGDDLQITVSGAQTNANTNGGSYTATAEITGGEDMDNYVLDGSSTTFTIAPKPITITFTANDSANPIDFDVAGSVTVGAWTIDSGNAGRATLVLSDGTTNITLTVEAASGEALPMTEENVPALLLLLGSELYVGTPYGTKVEGGSLTVISADPNYVFEGAQAITLNITPAISVVLQADVQTTLGLTEVLNTGYNAEYFKENYLKVINKDGEEIKGGTLEVTITPPKGVELLEGVIKHAGTYTVTAVYTPEGAGESAELPTYSFKFIVTPVEVTSVTYSGGSFVYGGLRASGEIAVTVEYADGKKAENVTAQYTSENVSNAGVVKAGKQTIKVSYTNDDSDYAAVTEHEITLTVEKKTITATIKYGEQSGTALTLTYNGSGGYTIGAELNDVLSGDGVSAEVLQSFIDVAESPYTVEITLNGNDKDNYMVKGEYTVTITPADVTYEWNFVTDAKITYGDSVDVIKALVDIDALNGTIPGATDPLTFEVSVGDYSATTNANTEVTFDVSYTLPAGAKEENYKIIITAADGNTLTVDKATLTLAIADTASLTKVYDGDAVTLDSLLTADNVSVGGMKNSEDAFKLGILAISGTDEMTNAGTYNGSVSVIEHCNYTAEAIEITYTVTPKPISVAWSNTEFTYDGTAHKPTATAVGLVEGDSLTLTVTGEQTNANAEGETYTATVKAFEQGNYKLESDSTQTFTIKKAAAALAIKDYDAIQDSVYKGSAFVVTPLLNGAEDTQGIVEVEFFDKTNSSATVAVQEIKNAGVYTVTLTVNNANYEYAQSSFTVTVSPKSIGVKWTNTEFTYNGSAQVPTATATGLVGGDSLTLTVTGAQTNAGSYTATVAAFEQGNYKLESASTQTFTIKKADLTVTPASLKIREREKEVMQAFAEGENLVEAFEGRINVSGVSGKVTYMVTIAGEDNYDDDGLLTVGAHTFTIDAVGGNYNAASVSVTVIATPVVTVIASVEGELVYNGSAFEISYALKEGAPVDVSMDDITVTASVETIVNAGEYKVTFTVTGSNEDYEYVVQDASGNATLTFTVAQRGLDVAEVAEAVYGNLQVSGTLVTGTHSAFVAYNDEEIELIVNVKTAALSRAAAEYLDAGEYEVTIALANEQGNFSLNGATLNAETEKMEVESTLDVAPKTVTVGYTPSSPVYDAKGISITLDKFEGMLIEGDDPAVNIYINDAPYTGKVVLDAGEYTVRYESADPNYAFAPVSATFTIAPKSVTPNFDLNTGSGSQQITGGGKLEIEEGEETDIVAAIDSFMQSSGVPEEEMSIAVSGDLKLEDMATWAPGTYTVTVTLSGNHSGSMQFTVEVSEKVELPPPVQPELPETPVEAGSGNDWVLPLIIAIVALIDLALLVAIGVAAKKRA